MKVGRVDVRGRGLINEKFRGLLKLYTVMNPKINITQNLLWLTLAV